jgi:hypothetical protein
MACRVYPLCGIAVADKLKRQQSSLENSRTSSGETSASDFLCFRARYGTIVRERCLLTKSYERILAVD